MINNLCRIGISKIEKYFLLLCSDHNAKTVNEILIDNYMDAITVFVFRSFSPLFINNRQLWVCVAMPADRKTIDKNIKNNA